jgi:hypothetical protein
MEDEKRSSLPNSDRLGQGTSDCRLRGTEPRSLKERQDVMLNNDRCDTVGCGSTIRRNES